jgi:archaellum component FlaC
MFEEIFRKAFIRSEPFQELLEKAEGADALSPIPSAAAKSKKPLAAPTNIGKKKVNAIKIPTGSPAGAKVKTGTQLDTSKTAVKKVITTPQGTQQKTFHESPMGEPAALVVPKAKKATQKPVGAGAGKSLEQPQQNVPHPKGGTVAVGHGSDKIPVVPEFDHKAKWYHDNLKIGDKVHFNAFSDAYGDYRPISSEVTALNPEGAKILHVQHPHKDFKDDPNAPPFPVHYGKILKFERADEKNPHLKHHFEYSGEFDNPDITSPEGVGPEKKIDPIAHHEHMQKREEIIKHKTDAIKQHLEGGDIVEFWTQDPLSKKISVLFGTAANLKPTQPQGGVGKAGGKSGASGQVDVNHVAVHTKDGVHEVPLDQVKRFGKYIVNKLHMYSFDPDNLEWMEDDKSSTGIHPADEESAMVTPKHIPGDAINTKVPEPSTQATSQIPENKIEPFADEPHPAASPLHPKDPKNVIHDAGGFVNHEDEDNIYFTHPDSKELFEIPREQVTPERVAQILGKKLVNTQEELDQKPAKATFDVTKHWTHHFPAEHVPNVRNMLHTVDTLRAKGTVIPPSILAARHHLLSDDSYENAYRAASQLQKYLKNPDPTKEIKPPTKLQDYQERLGMDPAELNDIGVAKEKLGGTKPADYYLQQKQAAAVDTLSKYAEAHNLHDLGVKLGHTDVTKDQRNLIDFYRHFLKQQSEKANPGQATAPLSLQLPTDEHIANARHLNELNEHLHRSKLDIPAYQNKLGQLNDVLQHTPDSPEVAKLFNELHTYAYDRAQNDPHYKAYMLQQNIQDKVADKIDPATMDKINERLEGVERGITNPEVATMQIGNYLQKLGIDVNKLMPDQNAGTMMTPTQSAKLRLNNLMNSRKFQEGQAETDQQLKKIEQGMEGKEGVAPLAGASPKTVKLPNSSGGMMDFSPKDLTEISNGIKKRIKDYQEIKSMPGADTHDTQAYLKNIAAGINDNISRYNHLSEKFAEMGEQVEPLDVDTSIFKNPKAVKEEGSLPSTEQLVHDFQNKIEADDKVWLRSAVEAQKNQINVERKHFLNFSRKFSPFVQQDIANIDKMMQQQLDEEKWEPLSEGTAMTPQGKKFLDVMNEYVAKVKRREKIAGMPIEEAYKSLADIISAEKTIVRRDVSLALRKAFYNDYEAPELPTAANLLASYFDDFIDTVMGTYKHIPVPVRKSILRSLLKSLIADVVKDNEFAASNMREDYTAPIDNEVVKSMGMEVANIVTLFRLEAEPEKTFFVIDINKGKKTRPHAIERELDNVKKYASGLRPIHNKQKLSSEEWFYKLKNLETQMYQAHMFSRRVSEHRLRKFVLDNDNKTVLNFYNDNLKQLNERLSSVEE